MLLIPVLWIIRRVATGHFVPATPLHGVLALLLLMVRVNLLVTFDVAYRWPKVAGIVYGVALYFAIVAPPRFLWSAVIAYLNTWCSSPSQ